MTGMGQYCRKEKEKEKKDMYILAMALYSLCQIYINPFSLHHSPNECISNKQTSHNLKRWLD